MTINEDAEYVVDSVDAIESAMMQSAKDYFGEDLNDDEYAVIRLFIRPIAEEFHRMQQDIGLVLASGQIDNATGNALDLLTALIGVPRKEATRSRGTVTFSRSSNATTDYVIPSGTIVQTDALDAVRFETTERAIIESGTSSVSGVPVRAIVGGSDGNVGANTLTVMPNRPTGVESVNNPTETTGGKDEEADEDLRARAKEELAEGSRATAAALISAVRSVEGVKDVTLFVNDTNTDNYYGNGLPAHSFELIVQGGSAQDVGQTILDTKAATDMTVGGTNGNSVSVSGDLPNGQTHPIDFSTPDTVNLNFDVTLTKGDTYEGDEAVKNAIVEYVGGTRSNGQAVDGDLNVGDDVIYNKVLSAVMAVNGVEDVSTLELGTASDPAGTSNHSIDNTGIATANATDSSINLTVN